MKRNFIVALALVVAVFMGAGCADAAIKITVKNNRSHNLSFAFCWAGFDYANDVSKGWYIVKAGETRTLNFESAKYALTSKGFGYYATGTPAGGKKLYWRGKGDDNSMMYWIHPSQAFTGSHNKAISGGQKVSFRKINLVKIDNENGRATITFNN